MKVRVGLNKNVRLVSAQIMPDDNATYAFTGADVKDITADICMEGDSVKDVVKRAKRRFKNYLKTHDTYDVFDYIAPID